MNRHLRYAGAALAFGIVLLLPYLNGHWKLADDAYLFSLPNFVLQARIIAEGMWPFWNPNVGMGQPWAISAGSGVWYPLQQLWGQWFGWSEARYLGFLLLHLTLAGWFAALFAEAAGLTVWASLFFGLAYVGNGTSICYFSNPNVYLLPATWWPLLGLGLLRLHGKPSERKGALRLIVGSVALIEVSAYPLTKIVIFLGTFLSYWGLARKRGRWLEGIPVRALAAAGAIALLLTAPEWLTSLQGLGVSERMGADIYDDSVYHNVSNFLQLATAVLPGQFLDRNKFQLGIMHLERSWWIGSLTLAFLFVTLIAGGRLRSAFGDGLARLKIPGLIAFFAFLFALGGHSFFRELMSLGFPLFEHLRHSHIARILTSTFLIFVASYGFSCLERRFPQGAPKPDAGRVGQGWIIFLVVCTAVAITETERPLLAKQLYWDAALGWKLGLLHGAFYLLLAYTAYRSRFGIGARHRWPAVVVVLQFLSLGDAGYSLRHVIAERRDEPFKVIEPGFHPASPQPNVRSLKAWFDGNDWYGWEGNTKVLNAYDPPAHRWLGEVKKGEKFAGLLSTLASCQVSESSDSCAGTNFRIDAHFGNIIQLSGESTAASVIMVHDFWDPHWTATLNGAPVQVARAADFFKAVRVPALPRWTLRFEYRHPLFPALWYVSLLGLALLIWAPKRIARLF